MTTSVITQYFLKWATKKYRTFLLYNVNNKKLIGFKEEKRYKLSKIATLALTFNRLRSGNLEYGA
ncbi:hypothetical protein K2X40_05065 [Candidatus Babeliales bacterium]|nr:hypothetical protein [Candidatus Babeliales bacterium]